MDVVEQSNLKLRIVSAAILIPATIACVYLGGWFYVALVFVFSAGVLYEWVRLSRKTLIPVRLTVFGVVYLALAASVMLALHLLISVDVTLFVFACVWSSDTGAYVFGKWIGGAKLLPSVSPNKTWAGFGGACLFPAIIIFVYGFLNDQLFDFSSILMALGFALTIGFSCQLGDLLVSKLKRLAGEKDSGKLIPGHGGVLDRLDSLLMASIFIFIYGIVAGVFI